MNFKKAVKDFERVRKIGELTVTLPEPPKDITTIGNYGVSDIDKRIFNPPPKELIKSLNYKFQSGTLFTDKEKDFMREEARRCEEGYWFFNKDRLEYVTNEHYFYLGYWVMPVITLVDGEFREDITTPIFRDSDRDNYYFWWHCVNDPKCYGMLEVTNRRDGKTARGVQHVYYGTSRKPRSRSGIQSKTDADAKEVFSKLVDSWRDMFEMFRPIDVGIDPPKEELVFDAPQKRGRKEPSKHKTEVLRSKIGYRSSKPESYDGYRMYRYLRDEAGKGDQDPKKTWYTVKEAQAINKIVVGKALVTTTSEDMESVAGMRFKELWDESDPNKRLPNGETESGLYRYFKPAYYGFMGDDDGDGTTTFFIDKWGYSNVEAARAYLEKYVASITPENRLSRYRKYPLEIDHCFYLPNKNAVLPVHLVNQQLRFVDELIGQGREPYERGNFYWIEHDSVVAWAEDPNGKFLATWLPNPEDRNRFAGGLTRYPTRSDIVIGIDPVDNSDKIADDRRKSRAAAYAMRKSYYNERHPEKEFIIQYVNRTYHPEEFFEDMLMMAVFCSARVLVENQKQGIIHHFRQRGYYGYFMERPDHMHTKWSKANQKEIGMPTTAGATKNSLIEQTQAYIYDNVGYNEELGTNNYSVMFPELLEDWANFNPVSWTPFDCFVAAAYTIAASKSEPPRRTVVEATNLLPIYGR